MKWHRWCCPHVVCNKSRLFYFSIRLSPALPAGDLSFKLLQLIPTRRLLAHDALHHAYFSSLPPAIYTIPDGEPHPPHRCMCMSIQQNELFILHTHTHTSTDASILTIPGVVYYRWTLTSAISVLCHLVCANVHVHTMCACVCLLYIYIWSQKSRLIQLNSLKFELQKKGVTNKNNFYYFYTLTWTLSQSHTLLALLLIGGCSYSWHGSVRCLLHKELRNVWPKIEFGIGGECLIAQHLQVLRG